MIQPHGGKLVNRLLTGKEAEEARKKAAGLKKLTLTPFEESDLEMIATGALSPLEGFMGKADFDSVLDRMHLASGPGANVPGLLDGNKTGLFAASRPDANAPGLQNGSKTGRFVASGLAWTLPVVKSLSADESKSLRPGEEAALVNSNGTVLAILKVDEVYSHDKKKHCQKAYGTGEATHPGVARVLAMEDFLVGGTVTVFERPRHTKFLEHRRDPAETRKIFETRGWKKVVAFQTRNPIHRAHEYLQKCALETVDGLMIHPLVGETKGDDVPAEVRMRCYEVLIEKYYQKNRVLLSVFPAAMRYAGPKEAIFHALVRKNYGCTHFIVGRDHAGVSRPDGKGFYGPFDAQKIFDEFKPEELGVTPLFFDNAFYCRACGSMASEKICPHNSQDRVSFSGTKVREMLRNGEIPPPEFTRPEVARVLIEAYQAKEK